MIKIGVLGAGGRMGKRIIAMIAEEDGVTLAAAVETHQADSLGRDAGELAGMTPLGVKVTESLDAAVKASDVLIDFSSPDATLDHLEESARHTVPIVVGTTGHTPEQKVAFDRVAQKIPIVMAPNMSIGVNVMWRVLAEAARALGDDYDVEIVEAHHRWKEDAPSGTAMRCAEVVAEVLGRDLAKEAVYHREGRTGARGGREIGIQTLRGGDIVGDHTVTFAGIGERLEITHRAASRDTFARGAVRAAKWLSGQQPGIYDMQDVLGL